ncbi:MAG: metal ABC transporter permease [Pseudomonadota bacterium]
MSDLFLLRALAAGVGIALIAGTLGCFVVWQRMAYFGDSLAHSALLGIALGLAFGIDFNLATVLTCSLFALLLLALQRTKILATDTLLGILAHSALSIGMVTMSMLQQRIDLHSFLFGDILTVTDAELLWIYLGGTVVLTLLIVNWSSLILMTIHEDLAVAENINTFLLHIMLIFLMTIVVAVSIRSVGVLLITSMLIIPAATARQITRSPEAMAVGASSLGIASVIIGIYGSVEFDTPTGPSIIVTCAVLFVLVLLLTTCFLKMKTWFKVRT